MKNKSCHLIQQSHYWAYIWEKKKKTIWKDTSTLNVHCNTIYNNQVMEATSTSINRGVDKEDVVHVYNGVLLSHKKEQNPANCSNMDGPRDYHTKWRKSDKYNMISLICGI